MADPHGFRSQSHISNTKVRLDSQVRIDLRLELNKPHWLPAAFERSILRYSKMMITTMV